MSSLFTKEPALSDAERRSRTAQALLTALVLTPFLLLPEPARGIAAIEATLLAVGLGIVGATAVDIFAANYKIRDEYAIPWTVAVLVALVVAVILFWLVAPGEHLPTLMHFAITFMWVSPITTMIRYGFRPRLADLRKAE